MLDYNANFSSAGQIVSLYAADEYRSSDHDPLIVKLQLETECYPICLPVITRND